MLPDRVECTCEQCVSSCHHRPGFFRPEEIGRAAALLNLSPQEFFRKYLVADFYYSDRGIIWMLAPGQEGIAGCEAPYNPLGTCNLLFSDRCTIHGEKPSECAFSHHSRTGEEHVSFRAEVVASWDNPEAQQFVRDILGREPQEPNATWADRLSLAGQIIFY